jgi:hypothetical protein
VSPRWGSKRWNALLSGGFHPRLLWYDPSGVLKIHLFYRVSILDFFTGFEKSISAKKSKFQTAEYSLMENLIWCQARFLFLFLTLFFIRSYGIKNLEWRNTGIHSGGGGKLFFFHEKHEKHEKKIGETADLKIRYQMTADSRQQAGGAGKFLFLTLKTQEGQKTQKNTDFRLQITAGSKPARPELKKNNQF